MLVVNLLAFILLSGITAQCDGACAPFVDEPYFATIPAAIDYYNQCSFSARNFSSSCVLSACPKLSGLCPNAATGCVNASALDAITFVLSTCLQTQEVICGVTVGHVPLCPLEISVDALIPPLLGGSCALKADTGFIDHLNNAIICVTGSDPFSVSISMPNLTSYAYYACSVTLSAPFSTNVNVPELHGLLTFNLQAEATVDLNSQPPTVQSNVQSSQIAWSANNLNELPEAIKDAFNIGINRLFQNGKTEAAAANFIATYVASGIQAAQNQCP